MRRKKGRSTYSFQMMIPIETTIILWATVVSLCFFAYCSCDEAAFRTKLSTISGHVDIESATRAMQPTLFTNDSSIVIEPNHHIHSNQSTHRSARTFKPSGNELWDGNLVDSQITKEMLFHTMFAYDLFCFSLLQA